MEFLEKTIPAEEYFRRYVDIPKFAGFCRECPNYGRSWSCAPFDFDPADVWARYGGLTVFAGRVYPAAGMTVEEAGGLLQKAKQELMDYGYALEEAAPGSLSLFAGTCRLCAECSRPEGQPCRQPERMRYSIEALGGDVGRTVKDFFDIDILWGTAERPPEYYVLCGGLLTP